MRLLLQIVLLVGVSGMLLAQVPPQTKPPNPVTTDGTVQPAQRHDSLLDLPPLPKNPVTLIGGILTRLDPVQDRLTVRAFGGQKLNINFDVRTEIYFNGTPVRQRELKQGQRVYVDTMLNGDKVFAKSIWINAVPPSGYGRGQIVGYDTSNRTLEVRDELTLQTLRFQLLPSTVIRRGDEAGSIGDLEPGALISLEFGPQQEHYPAVREIALIAKPGSVFSFFGQIIFLDMSRRVIALDNRTDGQKYEISLDAIPDRVARALHSGDEVGISAVFDGKHYVARTIKPAVPSPTTSE